MCMQQYKVGTFQTRIHDLKKKNLQSNKNEALSRFLSLRAKIKGFVDAKIFNSFQNPRNFGYKILVFGIQP